MKSYDLLTPTPNPLDGKKVTISANQYLQLLNDNSVLTCIQNIASGNEFSLKEQIGNYRKRNEQYVLDLIKEQESK